MVVKENKAFNMNKFAWVLLALFLIAGLIWFFKAEIVGFINRVPSNPVIVFPVVENRTILKKDFINNSVSLEISRFIADGAEQKTLWKLEYVDAEVFRTIGFELVYELDLGSYNLAEFYKKQLDVVKNNGWKLLATNFEDSRAFFDIERKLPSADYKVRIYAEQKDNHLEVKVQYLITRD